MVPPNLIFFSISRKESLEPEKKHALKNRFLRVLLCSNHNSNPGYNRKMLIGKGTSILDKGCLNYERLFHPVKCIARKICQCNSVDKLVLPRVTGILSVSGHFHYLPFTKCFSNGTRQNSNCLYQA